MELPCIGETKDLDERVRKDALGLFAQLSAGQTHFKISDSSGERSVVLVHGIAGPMDIWKSLSISLTENHFQVLRYDLFGRGYSDRPFGTYNIEFFYKQLQELLSQTHISFPIILIGWSLGGIISAAYAAKNPDHVDRLVLIAPAGIQVSLPSKSRIGMVPILGEILMSGLGRRLIIGSLVNGLYNKQLEKELLALISIQMQFRGYMRAFLSTLRTCGQFDASEIYRQVGANQVPVLMISGSHDPSIPGPVLPMIKKLIPNLEHYNVQEAGHFPHFEQPEEVSSRVLAFLN
jgi:pimeloyl-ACP methyl ester carboxylesterase